MEGSGTMSRERGTELHGGQGCSGGPPGSAWHDCGMARVRVSTTVDQDLLLQARALVGTSDAKLLDEALQALLVRHRAAEIDAAYEAYDRVPIDAPDDWGDLASWLDAAGRT